MWASVTPMYFYKYMFFYSIYKILYIKDLDRLFRLNKNKNPNEPCHIPVPFLSQSVTH